MKKVLIPLTPVPSLFGDDDAAVPARDDGIGGVLAACIQRYNRLENADAIGPVSLRRSTMRTLPTILFNWRRRAPNDAPEVLTNRDVRSLSDVPYPRRTRLIS